MIFKIVVWVLTFSFSKSIGFMNIKNEKKTTEIYNSMKQSQKMLCFLCMFVKNSKTNAKKPYLNNLVDFYYVFCD